MTGRIVTLTAAAWLAATSALNMHRYQLVSQLKLQGQVAGPFTDFLIAEIADTNAAITELNGAYVPAYHVIVDAAALEEIDTALIRHSGRLLRDRVLEQDAQSIVEISCAIDACDAARSAVRAAK